MTTLPFHLLLIFSLLFSLELASGEKAIEEESATVESDEQLGKLSLAAAAESNLTSTEAPKDQSGEKSASIGEIAPTTGEELAAEQKPTIDEEVDLHSTSAPLSAERADEEGAQDEGRSAAPSEAPLSEEAEVKEEQTSSTRAPLQAQTTEEEDNSSSREGSLNESLSSGVLGSLDEEENTSAEDADDASEQLLEGEVGEGSRAGRVGGAKPVARRSHPTTRRPVAMRPANNQANRQPRLAANKAKGRQLKTPPLRRPQGQSVQKTNSRKRAPNANGSSSTARRQGQRGQSSTFGKNLKSSSGVRRPSSTVKRPPHGAGGVMSKVNGQTPKRPPQNKLPNRASSSNQPAGKQILRPTGRRQANAMSNSIGRTKNTVLNNPKKLKQLNPVNAQNQLGVKRRRPTQAPLTSSYKKPPIRGPSTNNVASGEQRLKSRATASPRKNSLSKGPGRANFSANNRQQKTQALKVNPAKTSSAQTMANGDAGRKLAQVNPLPSVAAKPNLDLNGVRKQVPSAQVKAPVTKPLKPSSTSAKETAPKITSPTTSLTQVPPVTDNRRLQEKPKARPSNDPKPVVANSQAKPTRLKDSTSMNKQLPSNIDELPGTDKRTGRGIRALSGESLGTLPGTDKRTARRPRAEGGEPISTLPPYLVSVYSQTVSPDEKLKLQGQAILVGPDHALIHENSFRTIENWDKELPKNGDQELGSKVVSLGVDALGGKVAKGGSVFIDGLKDAGNLAVDSVLGDQPKPAGLKIERNSTIDAIDGGPTYNDKLHHFEVVKHNLDNSGFHLVRLTDVNKGDESAHKAWREMQLPKLETDPDNLGTGCHFYGFSRDTNYAPRGSPDREHKMVRIPIKDPKRGSCHRYGCQLETKQSLASGSCFPYDQSSPIVCGPERRLTYIARGQDCIRGTVDAVHVGSFAEQLEKTHNSWMATNKPYIEPSAILDRLYAPPKTES